MTRTIGMIGLGTMGMPMAGRLLQHGFTVRGTDIDAQRLGSLEAMGGFPCRNIAEVCNGSDVIITMLPRDQHVRAVMLDAGGVVEHAAAGTMLLEMSTVSQTTSIMLHAHLAEAGIRVLDAPVGGTPDDARAGTLLVMVGGDARDFQEATPILGALSESHVHLGPAGSGIRMKIANNYMTMVSMVLAAETLTLAEKAGIDVMKATKVLQKTVAGRGQINVNIPRKVLAGDIHPDFPIDMACKDLSLALALGDHLRVSLHLGEAALTLFEDAQHQGRGPQDYSAMFLALEQMSGLKAWMDLDGVRP